MPRLASAAEFSGSSSSPALKSARATSSRPSRQKASPRKCSACGLCGSIRNAVAVVGHGTVVIALHAGSAAALHVRARPAAGRAARPGQSPLSPDVALGVEVGVAATEPGPASDGSSRRASVKSEVLIEVAKVGVRVAAVAIGRTIVRIVADGQGEIGERARSCRPASRCIRPRLIAARTLLGSSRSAAV